MFELLDQLGPRKVRFVFIALLAAVALALAVAFFWPNPKPVPALPATVKELERAADQFQLSADKLRDSARLVGLDKQVWARAGEKAARQYDSLVTIYKSENEAFNRLSPAIRRLVVRDGLARFRPSPCPSCDSTLRRNH